MSSIEQGLIWNGINYHPDDSIGGDSTFDPEHPQEEQKVELVSTENPRRISRRQFLRKSLYAATGLAALATVVAEAAFDTPPDPDRQPNGPGTIPEIPEPPLSLEQQYLPEHRLSMQLDKSNKYVGQYRYTGNGKGNIAISHFHCEKNNILAPVWDKIEWFRNGISISANELPELTPQQREEQSHLLFPLQEILILRSPNIGRVMVDIGMGQPEGPNFDLVFDNFATQGANVIISSVSWGDMLKPIYQRLLNTNNIIILHFASNRGPAPDSIVGELQGELGEDPRVIGVGSLNVHEYRRRKDIIPNLDSSRGGTFKQPRIVEMGGLYYNKDNNLTYGDHTSYTVFAATKIANVKGINPNLGATDIADLVYNTTNYISLQELSEYRDETGTGIPLDGAWEGELDGLPYNTVTGRGYPNVEALFNATEETLGVEPVQISKVHAPIVKLNSQ